MPHFLHRIVNASLLIGMIGGAITVGLWMHRGCLIDCDRDAAGIVAIETITLPRPGPPELEPVTSAAWQTPHDFPDLGSDSLNRLLLEGDSRSARAMLMDRAATAAAGGDQQRLGNHLLMLGQIAIEEQNLDDAEVFLNEAMEIARLSNDPQAVAHVNLQLGRKHLRTRELARSAGEAYDLLLVARNELDRGRYADAARKLTAVIDENLAIRRYGAAASAYQSLGALYRKLHDLSPAELSLVEAARLYARSGANRKAYGLLRELETIAVDRGRILLLRDELDQLFTRFQQDVIQVEQARDYQRLARHYHASGDTQRAWELRLLANHSMAKTAKRSLYQRQADVLAVLYDSNRAMDAARDHFNLASQQFASQGMEDLAQQSRALTVGIW